MCRGSELEYVEGDISTRLRTEIIRAKAVPETDPTRDPESVKEGVSGSARVGVFAIHACDFLSDLIIQECMREGVDFAVMPCCSKVCNVCALAYTYCSGVWAEKTRGVWYLFVVAGEGGGGGRNFFSWGGGEEVCGGTSPWRRIDWTHSQSKARD